MADILLDQTSTVLAKVLDGAATRQQVLADNIANVETPGYRRKDVSFEAELREVMHRDGNPDQRLHAIERVAARTAEDLAAPSRPDGNTVNIEREMVEVAKNSLQYESAAQLLTQRMRLLKNAIREGRR